MNRSLFLSIHAVVAALVVVGFLAWQRVGGFEIGRSPRGDVGYLLATGWVALVLYLVVYAYVLRKYAHKLRYSPEFKLKVPRANLERVESKLNAIRREVTIGALVGEADILARAQAVLAEEGCTKIARAIVEPGRDGAPPRLNLLPTEPLGRVARWMHAHVYYALAGGVLVLLHGGGRFDTPMGYALNGLSLLVIASGLIGIVLWALGPTWMTNAERDLTIEEAFVLDRHFERKLDGALAPYEASDRATAAVFRNVERARVYPLERARVGLAALVAEAPTSAGIFQDMMVLAGQRQRASTSLSALMRLRFWLNAWRAVHVPASIVLLVFVLVHVASVLLY